LGATPRADDVAVWPEATDFHFSIKSGFAEILEEADGYGEAFCSVLLDLINEE
jgi:hypothetical protein